MALEITKTFVVKAAPEAVWSFLVDLPRVARCLPGAAIGEKLDERTSTGTMSIKVGPVSSTYKGKVVFERLDATSRTAELTASGQDVRGKGGADLRLTSSLKALPGGETEVTAVSLVNVTGLLAQMGRGMIQDVSDEMFQIFSERMRAELESASAAAGADGAGASAPSPAGATGTDGVARAGASGGDGVVPASATSTAGVAPAGATGTGGVAPAARGAPPVGRASLVGTSSPGPSVARPVESAPPEALDAAALGARVARRSAARWVRQPRFWLLILLIAAGLYLLLYRSS